MKRTLDEFMRAVGECEVTVRGKKRTYYLRTLSAVEHDYRQNHASAKARAMYRKLAVADSPEHHSYLAELAELPRQELEELAVSLNRSLILTRAAEREIHADNTPEPPDNPTLTEVLEVEIANEQIDEDVAQARTEWIAEATTQYQAEIAALDPEELLALVTKLRSDQIVNATYSDAFTDASLYWGVFTDKERKQPRFKRVEDVGCCDPALRNALGNEYFSLDVFATEAEELKN